MVTEASLDLQLKINAFCRSQEPPIKVGTSFKPFPRPLLPAVGNVSGAKHQINLAKYKLNHNYSPKLTNANAAQLLSNKVIPALSQSSHLGNSATTKLRLSPCNHLYHFCSSCNDVILLNLHVTLVIPLYHL